MTTIAGTVAGDTIDLTATMHRFMRLHRSIFLLRLHHPVSVFFFPRSLSAKEDYLGYSPTLKKLIIRVLARKPIER
jgi:hypothetical protein